MPMSNHTSLNDARLDRAIDRAVREMMQVDPAPGLRRRVLSRIDAPVARRARPVMRYAFAAAALAVLVLSITLLPDHVDAPTPPKAPPMNVAKATPVPPLAGVIPPHEDGVRASVKSSNVTKEPIRMPRITNVFGAQPPGVSAATVREPGPVRISPETLAPLAIVPLSARPIVIEPLVVGDALRGGR